MESGGRTNPWPLAMGLTGAALAVLLGGGTFLFFAIRPEPVGSVSGFASFTATDRSFACQYPQGWKTRAGDAQATRAFAQFTKGAAQIDVDADLTGSLIADASRAPGGMGLGEIPGVGGLPGAEAAAAPKKPPVEKLHEHYLDATRILLEGRGIRNYEEQAAQPYKSPVGEARVSEFTAKGSFMVGEVRGYRATALGGERALTTLAYAPAGDWEKLKPAFIRVITSVTAGAGR